MDATTYSFLWGKGVLWEYKDLMRWITRCQTIVDGTLISSKTFFKLSFGFPTTFYFTSQEWGFEINKLLTREVFLDLFRTNQQTKITFLKLHLVLQVLRILLNIKAKVACGVKRLKKVRTIFLLVYSVLAS